MDLEQARWGGVLASRAHALGPVDCPCQAGPSPMCAVWKQHHRCYTRPPGPVPESFLTNSEGLVVTDQRGAVAVWLSGTPCRYRCTCHCHETAQLELDLFV